MKIRNNFVLAMRKQCKGIKHKNKDEKRLSSINESKELIELYYEELEQVDELTTS